MGSVSEILLGVGVLVFLNAHAQPPRCCLPSAYQSEHRSEAQAGSILNSARDFIGLNLGKNGVALNFTDVPKSTGRLIVSRSAERPGHWKRIIDVKYSSDLPQPLVDVVDATRDQLCYRLQAVSLAGHVLKTYGYICIPPNRD